ncbi:MAG: dienelactone hydrolase family protein [Alphaproteobacteria bacterium]
MKIFLYLVNLLLATLVFLVAPLGWLMEATAQSKLEPYYHLLRPGGAGPFPALMLVPSCSGITSSRLSQAQELKGHGYVVIFVDYLSARGLENVCRGEVPGRDVARDMRDSARYLRSQPFVNPSQIGVIGWSGGAGAIIAALVGTQSNEEAPFRAAALFYPGCRGRRPWKVSVPVIMLLGGLDDVAPPQYCEKLVKDVPQGNPVEVHLYAEARHSFDRSDLRSLVQRPLLGGTVGYNEPAATQAWEEVRKFLNTHLRSQ